jgi:hypothetical protein
MKSWKSAAFRNEPGRASRWSGGRAPTNMPMPGAFHSASCAGASDGCCSEEGSGRVLTLRDKEQRCVAAITGKWLRCQEVEISAAEADRVGVILDDGVDARDARRAWTVSMISALSIPCR